MTTLLRWSIDEISDDTVTVLQSTYRHEFEGFSPFDLPAQLQKLEESVTTDDWSEEEAETSDLPDVQAFIDRALGEQARPLREGDVYWLEAAEPAPLLELTRNLLSTITEAVSGTRPFLPPTGTLSLKDGTASARDAVKSEYAHAIEQNEMVERRGMV